MILGVILGLATAVIWGSGDFLSRKPSRKIGAFHSTIYVQPVGLVLLLIFSLLSGGLDYSLLASNPTMSLVNILAGIASFAGLLFLFRGYATGLISVVAPIAGAYPAVTVVLAVVLLGAALNQITILAIVAIIAGIILSGVNLGDLVRSGGSKKLTEGVDSGILTCLCAGFGLFGIGVVTPIFGSVLPAVVVKISETVVGFLLIVLLNRKFIVPRGRTLLWLLIIGACDAGGFLTFSYGILTAGNNLPIVVTLSGLTGVVTMFLARAFYGERMEKIQALGVLIIMIGVATVLYF